MTKTIYFILLIFIFSSCNNSTPSINNNEKEIFYTSKVGFGLETPNTIKMSELDSLISKIPFDRLGSETQKPERYSEAIKLLKEYFEDIDVKPQYIFIYGVKDINDSIIEFYLQHLDYFVYKNNLEKKNLELSSRPDKDGSYEVIPPITGNVSGVEGWYKVNIETKKIEISWAQ